MANTLNLGDGNWATKKDSLLGYNSENNNFKPLPFDFTRSSLATRINKNGLIETVGGEIPRIDFSNNTKGALLLEPTRSNLILTSASGTYGNSPASETNTISPDGTNNAVIPTPDATADRYEHSIGSNTYATDTKLVYSWYRKRISTPIDTSFLGDLQFKVLVNATPVGSTTQIQSDVNGFDRFQAVLKIIDGSSYTTIRAYFGHIIGIGNSSVAYFGHQLEVGSYATSYIPTSGSSVQRAAETANGSGNSEVFNDSEGVLFADISALTNIGNDRRIAISDGSTSNRIFFYYAPNSDQVSAIIVDGGATQVNILILGIQDKNNKLAIKYKVNDVSLWVNGFEVGTDTNATMPSNLSELAFDDGGGSNDFHGKTKEIAYYDEILTDAELETLTSYRSLNEMVIELNLNAL